MRRTRQVSLVYFVRASNGMVKIGTTRNWSARCSNLRGLAPEFLFGLSSANLNLGPQVEAMFHTHFEHLRYGRKELFRLTDLDLFEAAHLPIYKVELDNGKFTPPLCLCHGWKATWDSPSECELRLVLLNRIRPKSQPLIIPSQVLTSNLSQ
jgi:hypothetical protein